MAVIKAEIRTGAYYDSVVLMQLQRALAALPGIVDAGVVMGTAANKDILAQSDLLAPEAQAAAAAMVQAAAAAMVQAAAAGMVQAAAADDLAIVVRAQDGAAAQAALEQVDELLTQRRRGVEQDYLPKSLESAVEMLPAAQWVMISVPGRYAAGVARQG